VYFDLSGYPPTEWRSIFQEGWVATKLPHRVDLEQSFLVVYCELEEIGAVVLPALKKVVTETNEAYARFAEKEATALEHREDLWREERQRVEATAASLTFG
jgi:predicted RecB family endonuclease